MKKRARQSSSIVVAGAVALYGATTTVHAQTPSAPTAAATEQSLADSLTGQAKVDYDLGRLLYNDHDDAGAYVKFEHAYQQSHDPRLLWNMATCEKNRRHYAQVLSLIDRYQREGAGRLTAAQRSEAAEVARTVRLLVSEVHLEVNEAGASVFVDDELIGTTPVAHPIHVNLGKRRVRVSKAGFKDHVIVQDFTGGSEVTFSLALQPAPHEGHVTIATTAHGSIQIDGKMMGEGRWEGQMASGTHSIRVTAPDMVPYSTEVNVRDGESRTLDITLEAQKSGVPAFVWIGAGVLAVGGLSVGGYFLFRPTDAAPPATVGTLSPGTIQLPMVF
jgi:hypothetical protein